MRVSFVTIGFLCALLVSGCDVKNTPIPLKDSPLAGIWEGSQQRVKNGVLQVDRMYLEFTEEGYVAFQRVSCWADADDQPRLWKTKDFKIDFMPVIKLNQKKAKAQWMPFTPKVEFSLDAWPETQDGLTQMTVDGMVLDLVEVASDRSEWQCEKMVAEQDQRTI